MRTQFKSLTKIFVLIALALGLGACGVRGDLIAPSADAAPGIQLPFLG